MLYASERHRTERRALFDKLYGAERVRRDPVRYELFNPGREARKWEKVAADARTDTAALRALPPEQAARRIKAQRTAAKQAAEAAKITAEQRARRLHDESWSTGRSRSVPYRDGPHLVM